MKLKSYTQENVELIAAQAAFTETAHCITKQENYLLSHRHLQWTQQLTVLQGVPETGPGKPLHTNSVTTSRLTTQYDSPVSVQVPQFMGSLNMHNMYTLHSTVLRTSSPRIRNYADSDGKTGTGRNFRPSHAAPCHICTAQVITQ